MTGAAVPAYATGPAGQVRFWRCGAGPDLCCLAGPSWSASDLAESVRALAPGWRVTAFELPGIGGSARCRADDLDAAASAVSDAVAASGIGRHVLMALDLAIGIASRLAQADALIEVGGERAGAWARSGREAPGLKPRQDGTHLLALWAFLRDTHLLDPADPGQPATSGEALPDDATLDRAFVAAAVDPERFAALWNACLADAGSAAGADTRRLAVPQVADLPAALAGIEPLPEGRAAPPTAAAPGRTIWHDYVETPRGRIHLRRAGGEGPPLLVIPTGGGSSAQFAPVVQGLAEGRQVFSLDYLDNGLSDKPDREVTIELLAEDVAALVAAMGLPRVDVWGSHTGASVGLEFAVRHPERVGRLVLEGPVFVAPDFQADLLANYFPPIAPDKWGRHIPLVWNWRRDMFMFWPWYRVAREAARSLGVPRAQDLHDYAIGILESGPLYDRAYRAAFAYDTRARLLKLRRPALVCAGPNDMLINGLAETEALAVPGVMVRRTPTTVWWPAPEPRAAAETLAIYDAFLRG